MSNTDVSLRRTPDGYRLEVARLVDADAATVWEVLTDTRQWSRWGPSVGAVECPTDFIDARTSGRVRVAGVWIPFDIDDYDPNHYRWTWRVAKIPATGHRVDTLSAGRCRVVFELPPLAGGYALVCERALRRIERLATKK